MNEETKNVEEVEETDNTEKKKRKKKRKTILNKKITIRSTLIIILVLILMVGSFFGGYAVTKKKFFKPEKISKGILYEHIRKCQDLITARDDVKGRVPYSDGKIPGLTKNSFKMDYVAHFTAGVNLKEVKVDVKGKTIIVTTPHAVIKDLYVDGNSLQFTEDTGSILSHRRHEHVPKAIARAKKQAKAKAHKKKTLEMADKQIKKVFKELLHFAEKKKYKVKVVFK